MYLSITTKSKLDNPWKIEFQEMSMILWALEGVYTRLVGDKTKDGKKQYKRCKALHRKLYKEFMSR